MNKVIIDISKASVLDDVNFTQQAIEYMSWNPNAAQLLTHEYGKESYKLLAYISLNLKIFPKGFIADLGTKYGNSALTLSINENNVVYTYDIINYIPNNVNSILKKSNIQRKMMSAQLDLKFISNCHFIYLDIDNTTELLEELKIYKYLCESNYKGLLFIDKIKLSSHVETFLSKIKHKIVDVTKLGHWAGSYVVVFDEEYYDIKI